MTVRILTGDCRDVLASLPADSVHCCVTSPPYWGLRDYGVAGQLGLEPTFTEFIDKMVEVFREVRRVLRPDGTLWLNLGDSYAGSWGAQGRDGEMAARAIVSARQVEAHPKRSSHTGTIRDAGLKPKDLCGIPWRVAIALQEDGWWLRQDIIWHKPNPMPESVTDRCTKAHEYLFLLSKSARYFFDAEAITERVTQSSIDRVAQNGGNPVWNGNRERSSTQNPQTIHIKKMVREDGSRNKRSVWTVATQPFSEAHFATFPPALIEPAILAGCPPGGTVLDPFGGAGTTGLVADRLQRDAILIELNPDYVAMAQRRIAADAPLLTQWPEAAE